MMTETAVMVRRRGRAGRSPTCASGARPSGRWRKVSSAENASFMGRVLHGLRLLLGAGPAVGVERLGERRRKLLRGLILDVPPLENELELPAAQEPDTR